MSRAEPHDLADVLGIEWTDDGLSSSLDIPVEDCNIVPEARTVDKVDRPSARRYELEVLFASEWSGCHRVDAQRKVGE